MGKRLSCLSLRQERSLIKMLISNEMKEGQKVHVPGVIYNHLVSGFVVMIIFLNPVVLK